MIEIIFETISAIIQAIVSLFGAIIEAIAGIFTAGGEALSAGEAIGTLISFILEIILWGVLWFFELIVSLFTLRKPRKVKRPKIWKNKKDNNDENT